MQKHIPLVVLVVVLFGGSSHASAALVYDIYTNSTAGNDLLTGSIGFQNLAGDYQGAVTDTDVTLFEWDGAVLGSLFAPDPDDWILSKVTANIDVLNGSLLITELWAAPLPPTAGGLNLNNVGTAQTGGFGYVLGLFMVRGDAYLRARQTPVPEPSAIALVAIGLAGIGWARLRRG